MSVEARRGCGFRKIGGLYLVGMPWGSPCCKLPRELEVCPTCGAGIKQARGWTWIDGEAIFAGECRGQNRDFDRSHYCPLSAPERLVRVGLLWVGERFYPTPEHFEHEAASLGISKRIAAVPRGFQLGATWVALAHPAVRSATVGLSRPAIFRVFQPTAIENLLPESARDSAAAARLRDAGVTPVFVPDADPDHQGTVYDDEGQT